MRSDLISKADLKFTIETGVSVIPAVLRHPEYHAGFHAGMIHRQNEILHIIDTLPPVSEVITPRKVIDPAPIIKKLAERCLASKGLECSVLGNVIDMLKAAPNVIDIYIGNHWISVGERLPEEGE